MKKIAFGLAFSGLLVAYGCGNKSEDSTIKTSSGNETSQLIGKLTDMVSSGLDNGYDAPSKFVMNPAIKSANSLGDFDCNDHGWTGTDGDGQENTPGSNWAYKQLYCLLRAPVSGPDSFYGALTQSKSFVCAVGNLNFDGVKRAATFRVSTACFSQDFVDQAASEGITSLPVDLTGMTNGQFASGLGFTPVGSWNKALIVDFKGALDDKEGLTILIKDDAGAKAVAIYQGLPSSTNVKEVFAVYADSATGVISYEGRFDGSSGDGTDVQRHLRGYLQGTVNASTNEVSNVEQMSFVWSDTYDQNTGSGHARYASIKGTPAAGRYVASKAASSLAIPLTDTQLNQMKYDNKCYGEAGATCTGNTGITAASATSGNAAKFFFLNSSGHTNAKTWLQNNAFLSGFSANITMNDIQ